MATLILEENELMKDSKYRLYVSAVDKALKNFEYTTEWPDLISALGKLNKVLLSYTKYPVIPRRIKLSKRLSQCMHPALPAGVHLKALETYDVIFKCMGTNRLAQELFIYSAGLFPLLGYAATPVRPALLAVYEAHFVPLGQRLLPALSGFLAGVLPGLEPGSDHHDSTNGLLERVSEAVGRYNFYEALWQCVQCDSPARAPAVAFALTHITKKSYNSLQYCQGSNLELMINALEQALQDISVLVQRSALDLLLIALPIHGDPPPPASLISAALHTVLRRDMSLNRRLYSWLLGSEINTSNLPDDHPLVRMKSDTLDKNTLNNYYYETYSHTIVLKALESILKQSCVQHPIDVRPYRILTSLLDKPEIAPEILDVILYDVFRTLYLTCQHQIDETNKTNNDLSKKNQQENLTPHRRSSSRKSLLANTCQDLIKHANLLFNTLETYYIWQYVGDLFAQSIERNDPKRHSESVREVGSGTPDIFELCLLTELLLDIIPVETYIDSSSEILPNLFMRIVSLTTDNLSIFTPSEINETLKLCTTILTKIQPILIKTFPKTGFNHNSNVITDISDNSKVEMNVSEKSKSSSDLSENRISQTQIKFDIASYNSIDNASNCDTSLGSESLKANLNLEKSKSDSKLNENGLTDSLTDDRERSNSNQMLRRFNKSPKQEKKTKNKKSKSSPKLFDFKQQDTKELISEKLNISETIVSNIITTEIENKLIIKCLEVYKIFYITLLQKRIFKNITLLSFYDKLIRNKNPEDQSTLRLEKLLQNVNSTCYYPEEETFSIDLLSDEFRTNMYLRDYEEALKTASLMLVEFTTFPNILDVDVIEKDLPLWLKYLTVVACLNYNDSMDTQLVCMNAMLEIISLSKTFSHIKLNEKNSTIVMGILRGEYLSFIENSTIIIEMITETLWDFLGISITHSQMAVCVSLLYQIHNIFSGGDIVENVIGRHLVGKYTFLDNFRRFALIWHMGRDLDSNGTLSQKNSKNFDKCLLKIFDNLQNHEDVSLKLFAESFVLHCLLRSDIPRLITPLLVMLLTPNTARISVLHANIEKSEELSSNQSTTKTNDISLGNIYAISSVDGHVMYHVADNRRKNSQSKHYPFFNKKSTEVVNIATSLVDDNNVVTLKNSDFKTNDLPTLKDGLNRNIKVFVNPLDDKDSSSDKSSVESLSTSESTTENNEVDSLSTDEKAFIICDPDSGLLNENELLNENSLDFELANDVPAEYKEKKMKKLNEQKKINLNETSTFSTATKVSAYLEHIENISDGVTQEETINKIHNEKLKKSQSLDETVVEKDEVDVVEDSSLVHSWSYETSESIKHIDGDLELSTTAEEFFENGRSKQSDNEHTTEEVVELRNKSVEKEAPNRIKVNRSILKNRGYTPKKYEEPIVVSSTHSHLLLYREVYDSNIILYALRTLKTIISANSRILISCLSRTALQSSSELINVLSRHRKSVYGYGFYGDNSEYINYYRGNMYLEVLISTCLTYARSFYPNLTTSKLTNYEIDNNLKIQLECLDLLNLIIKELVLIVKDSGKGFASYIADMLLKCKLQKVLLHSLVASVKTCEVNKKSFTDEILIFNNFILKKSDRRASEYIESFQIQLLRLIQSLIALEYYVSSRGDCIPTCTIPQQATFRAAVLTALQTPALRSIHRAWAGTIAASLPYLGTSLTQVVLSVIHQLCSNIETISKVYNTNQNSDTVQLVQEAHRKTFMPEVLASFSIKSLSTDFNLTPVDSIDDFKIENRNAKVTTNGDDWRYRNIQKQHSADNCNDVTPDYAISQLESLAVLCHYCLLDTSQQCLNALTQPNGTTMNSLQGVGAGQIFNNLLSAFLPTPYIDDVNNSKSKTLEGYQESRKAVLSHLPRIITSVALLWQYVSIDNNDSSSNVLGNRNILKKQLLEFLSPISLHHSTHFIAAISVAWNERKKEDLFNRSVIPSPTDSQKSLVNLISSIRVIPVDNLVQTIHSVIKTPPVTEGVKTDINLDVSILELFYCYIQSISSSQLLESWGSLLNLLKDGPTFNPPSQFLMLAIVNEFVQKCSPLTEKKDQKELQDVTAKMIESVSQISGSGLEQTTWLRRNLAVREEDTNSTSTPTPEISNGQSYSLQAQLILAEILAPLLDVCFGSQEKDKVISIISSLMNNVVPYLKKHSLRNASNWAACSSLLASLSGYPATRRAWRREALELLLDPLLFKMPKECLAHWRHIVDHLMTHDNTTFRELMSRVSLGQSGGLNLFSSRDQEAEQRAMLIKRLAFVILCGDVDQYSKHMPEIQEQLANGLRLGAPNVAAAVFLCCRALLLKISPLHITSLWPLILCECLQALIRTEHQLSSNSDQLSSSVLGLDGGWTTCDSLSSDGLKRIIGVLQLLDLALLIDRQHLPHFQMYQWAFVNDIQIKNSEDSLIYLFEPHLCKILKLMDTRYGKCDTILEPHASGLFITRCSFDGLSTLTDLHALLQALTNRKRHHSASPSDVMPAVEMDFLEKIPP